MVSEEEELHHRHAEIVCSEGVNEKTDAIIKEIQRIRKVQWVRVGSLTKKQREYLGIKDE